MSEEKSVNAEKALLEQHELLEKISKLKKENKFLDFQLSDKYRRLESIKALTGLGGVFAAVFTLITVVTTVWKWNDDAKQSQAVKNEERIDKALQRLGDPSNRVRLSGIISLRSFLTENYSIKNSQVLLSLSNALTLEDDPTVRNAIVEVFRSKEIQSIDSNNLKEALGSLAASSRTIVTNGKLDIVKKNPYYWGPDSNLAKAVSISQCIVALLKKGIQIEDLSGIFCMKCDLTNLNLSKVVFDNSDLAFADFSNTVCTDCRFEGSDLQQTQFIGAHLKGSKFTMPDNKKPGRSGEDYVFKALTRYDEVPGYYIGPNFNCADLSHTDFSGHPLTYMVDARLSKKYSLSPPTFFNCILDSANFINTTIICIGNNRDFPISYSSSIGFQLQDSSWIYEIQLGSLSHFQGGGNFASSLISLSSAFDGSDWSKAKFNKALVDIFTETPPHKEIREIWRNNLCD